MINLDKIRRQRTWKATFKELLVFALPLFFILYGLKCILTLRGKIPVTVMGTVYHSTHLMLATGFASVMIGLSYIGFGSFLYLSDGQPPNENRTWLWRITRCVIRWGSLLAMLAFWHEANLLRVGSNESFFYFLPSIETNDEVRTLILIAITVGIILLLGLLMAIFAREQVKKDLWAKTCKPLHIWWCPLAYWLPWVTYLGATGFRVFYFDTNGFTHKGYCIVYRSFFENPRLGLISVKWLRDTVTDQLPAPEVWVDSEIIRPKLKPWDVSNESNDLLDDSNKAEN
jgi:hypothetical protein